jgi:hypothetical protein
VEAGGVERCAGELSAGALPSSDHSSRVLDADSADQPAEQDQCAGHADTDLTPDGPYFEVAIVHHTGCGSRLLEDEQLRHGFAERGGYDERMLADLPVTDPAQTVRADVDRLLAAPQISPHTRVSGHVYDVETGLITTVVDSTSRAA